MQNMDELLRQAQAMQERMTKIQDELSRKTVEGLSGGGMVRAVCTGKQELVSVKIDQTAVDPTDVEMLQDLVTAAVNDALNLARKMMEQEMAELTGGMKLPGM